MPGGRRRMTGGGVRRRTLVAGGAGLAVLAACDADRGEASGTLRIATGSRAAVYYAYGSAIARLAGQYLPDVQASVLETAASDDNVHRVLVGTAELAFTQADIAGSAATTAPNQLAALARIYDDYVHLVVRRGGPIASVADLQGRRVSVGAQGSGTGITANRILDTLGADFKSRVTRRELNVEDSAAALERGEIDGFFFSGGLPVGAIEQLAKRFPIALVALDKHIPQLRVHGDYYAERLVPASTYRGISPTVTIGIANYLVVRVSMPEPLAHDVTRLLFERRDELAKAHQAAGRLNIRSAISTPPLPLHRGAARYYRSQKA
ncbi:TAXI family TRAP transporter solute-binding subunit [Dactylosporangium aurantiacum]|nr:TAXI family TRAP transporter solute-binding subunit [Dactylosporangium aurantiacum]MDG6102768.1 TAXI family TRAP transporter solute-binding subunit [Dactylosporangium aurantiacum]